MNINKQLKDIKLQNKLKLLCKHPVNPVLF